MGNKWGKMAGLCKRKVLGTMEWKMSHNKGQSACKWVVKIVFNDYNLIRNQSGEYLYQTNKFP